MDGLFRKIRVKWALGVVLRALFQVFFLLSAGFFSFQTLAQNSSSQGSRDQAPRVTTLDFEDELIEGGVTRPELLYIFQKRNFNYKPLIELRENFIPETRRSAEQVRN
jgi:hypothetical protein